MNFEPPQEREIVRQNNLAYAGLIGAALLMVQPFLAAPRLDVAAKICVVSFAVAIPLLAALVLVAQQEMFRQRATTSVVVLIAKPVALACAFVGVVAGFWHVIWIAGVAMIVAAFVAMLVHAAGYVRLELESSSTLRDYVDHVRAEAVRRARARAHDRTHR
jgi:hypothetical protein